MKYLNKYNEADAFNNDDITLIKEIILELKHEYPSIQGEITNRKFDGSIYTVITINPLPIYNESSIRLNNIEKRLKYFNDIFECSKRLQDVFDREVRIMNLFNHTSQDVEIWIDDPKNKLK